MRFDILTLFPEMFTGILSSSILKRAIEKKQIEVNLIDFREFSTNKHHTVDDYAYGGGAGMLISVEPIHLALKTIPNLDNAHVILTSPIGKTFNQETAKAYSEKEHIVIICGHYEGIDDRIHHYIDEEVSIGDYVLTGGETPAMIIVDAVSRLVDGVISSDSIKDETFNNNLLEYPQYTRPAIYDGHAVPDVLISGHHAKIEEFKKYESIKRTYKYRPDLLEKANLSKEELKMLEAIKNEENN
ncbi:MAG: tRNA (guanosine(37)-N1)-methyltransferase TrmD [Bacilli bacterium]|nr:tRNA (guanosine(37)-N1)-methyltransferase TrmD [Bacilli bacterium]